VILDDAISIGTGTLSVLLVKIIGKEDSFDDAPNLFPNCKLITRNYGQGDVAIQTFINKSNKQIYIKSRP
jgi:hypothetical protein